MAHEQQGNCHLLSNRGDGYEPSEIRKGNWKIERSRERADKEEGGGWGGRRWKLTAEVLEWVKMTIDVDVIGK